MAFSTIPGTGGAPDSFVGTAGVDTIAFVNTPGNFVLTAAGDDDLIDFVGSGTAPVATGATLRGGDGVDTFNDNLVVGTVFSSVLINGNAGDDVLNFNNSTFVGSTIQGGQGDDFIDLNLLNSSIVNGNKGEDLIQFFTSVNSFVRGGADDDIIRFFGDAQGTDINGNLGNDEITLFGNSQDSKILGGDDDDLININGSLNGSIVNGNKSSDTINVSSTGFADSTVFGGAGNDSINGNGATNDGLFLSGDLGNDTITGSALDDTIIGGAGADEMTGNGGANTFEFASLADTFTGALSGGVTDVITDFVSGIDELDLLITGAAGGLNDDGTAFADYDAAFAAANTYFAGNSDIYFFASNVTAGGNVLFIANAAGSTSASGAINFGGATIVATDIV